LGVALVLWHWLPDVDIYCSLVLWHWLPDVDIYCSLVLWSWAGVDIDCSLVMLHYHAGFPDCEGHFTQELSHAGFPDCEGHFTQELFYAGTSSSSTSPGCVCARVCVRVYVYARVCEFGLRGA
jgi:hypothetical protein